MVNWAVIWMGSDQGHSASKQSPSIFLEKSGMRLCSQGKSGINWFFFYHKGTAQPFQIVQTESGVHLWDRGTYTSFVHLLSVAQPRPQGAFPWLRLQSQGERPGDEVERSPHCTLLAYKGTVHPETDIRYGEIIQIVCCSNLIYHKSSIKYPPLK